MSTRKDNWRHEEDEAIIETLLAYAKSNKTQSEAFRYLSEILYGRSLSAINQRWHSYLKAKVIGNPLYVQESNEPDTITLDIDTCLKILNTQNLEQVTVSIVNKILRSHLISKA